MGFNSAFKGLRSFMISTTFCYRNLRNSTELHYASYGRNNRILFERGVWPLMSHLLVFRKEQEFLRGVVSKKRWWVGNVECWARWPRGKPWVRWNT